jgi:polysaccharide export outer membrane protein
MTMINKMSYLKVLAFLIMFGCSLNAQETGPTGGSANPHPSTPLTVPVDDPALYRIGPGDVLEIRVAKHDDLSLTTRVDNNGYIRLPRVENDIRAACRTEKSLADEIEKSMWFLRRPDVYVSVKEYNSKPVSVLGAVNSPGRFQLQREVKLLELITLVNGPSAQAGKVIHLIHTASTRACGDAANSDVEPTEITEGFTEFPIEETMRAVAAYNPVIQPGDIVRIPDAPEPPKAYIIGSVTNPQAIPLKEPITITQAIAIANGTAPGANTDKIRIIRQLPGSTTKTELLVSLKLVNSNRGEDIVLQPNDVINIPGPGKPGFGRSILEGLGRMVMPSFFPYPTQVIR